jgi:hypothetical protein
MDLGSPKGEDEDKGEEDIDLSEFVDEPDEDDEELPKKAKEYASSSEG